MDVQEICINYCMSYLSLLWSLHKYCRFIEFTEHWKPLRCTNKKLIHVHSVLTKSCSHKLSDIKETWISTLLHLKNMKKPLHYKQNCFLWQIYSVVLWKLLIILTILFSVCVMLSPLAIRKIMGIHTWYNSDFCFSFTDFRTATKIQLDMQQDILEYDWIY